MKIVLFIALYVISAPVDCSDVIGYAGGSVIILSNMQWYLHDSKYICKVKENDCIDVIRADTKRFRVQEGRFILYSNQRKYFLVMIRKLKPQDAGTYRFGLGNQSNTTVNLKVYNNASCGVPKIMNTYLGQNITINCNYPEEYEKNSKYLDSVDDDSNIKNFGNTNTNPQNGRFSISDDRSAKVLRVNISDVREADEVFYLFGVWNGDGSVRYYTYFIEMWLHVTGLSTTVQPTTTTIRTIAAATTIVAATTIAAATTPPPTPPPPTPPPPPPPPPPTTPPPPPTTTGSHVMTLAALQETPSAVCFSPSVIIIVCVCASLLLIGGFGLMIYKLRHKRTQSYTPSFKTEQEKPVLSDSANLYETSPI